MLTPPNTYSIEWLNETRDRMKELQAKLERTFPAHLLPSSRSARSLRFSGGNATERKTPC